MQLTCLLMICVSVISLLNGVLKLMPLIYYLLAFANISFVLQYDMLTKSVITNKDQFQIRDRNRFLRFWYFMSFLEILVGLNPIKPFGSLCTQDWPYPLGFLFVFAFQLLFSLQVNRAIETSNGLIIKDKKLQEFYDSSKVLRDGVTLTRGRTIKQIEDSVAKQEEKVFTGCIGPISELDD